MLNPISWALAAASLSRVRPQSQEPVRAKMGAATVGTEVLYKRGRDAATSKASRAQARAATHLPWMARVRARKTKLRAKSQRLLSCSRT